MAVGFAYFFFTMFLFATSNTNRQTNNNKTYNKESRFSMEKKTAGPAKGRNRYSRSGKKRTSRGNLDPTRNDGNKSSSSKNTKLEFIPPPLTKPNGPRPTYFTCRHTYEDALMEEIQRELLRYGGDEQQGIRINSPSPGLVCVGNGSSRLADSYDPVYALQTIPNAVVVTSTSIKGLAKAIYSELLDEEQSSSNDLVQQLRSAPRGSLAIHSIVPGMCKGQSNPVMLNRSQRIAEELGSMFRKVFPAARKRSTNDDLEESSLDYGEEERWVCQILLVSPDVAVASLTKCIQIGPGKNFWPNWHHPVGMAKVDISEVMPSSAYRKLMEAFECMRIAPEPFQSSAVDLGACPGGWTSVLRRLDCHVVSVDRSKLDPVLMKDDMVDFVKGDAFTFSPPAAGDRVDKKVSPRNSWMVSDVIAYPERIIELLDRWCGNHWASHMVITMKFQGDKPSFDELDQACSVTQGHGYICRAKHFFNNKNEVTLMIHEKRNDNKISPHHLDDGILGTAMYDAILP